MSKSVAVSDDAGSTYSTLPGNAGELNNEAGTMDDTIFGQTFQSNESGLINWGVNAQAFYKGFAGYQAKLKKQGTSTTMTTEAMTLVAGKTYKITAATKNIWDPAGVFTVFDGGVDHTADVLSINYLFGQVTFKAAYTPTGAITVTGKYFTTVALGNAQAFTLTQTAEAVDNSAFDTVQANGGYRIFTSGLRTVGLELSGFYNITAAYRAALQSRSTIIIEIDPAGTGASVARGFFKPVTDNQNGDVGALEEETISFVLQVPSTDYLPFSWDHTSGTTLHASIKKVITAWLTQVPIMVKYLYDGTNGVSGNAIVTNMSLSSGLDKMNEFALEFQGTGVQTTVGTG